MQIFIEHILVQGLQSNVWVFIGTQNQKRNLLIKNSAVGLVPFTAFSTSFMALSVGLLMVSCFPKEFPNVVHSNRVESNVKFVFLLSVGFISQWNFRMKCT